MLLRRLRRRRRRIGTADGAVASSSAATSPRSGLSPFSSLLFMIRDCSVSASSRFMTRWRSTASLKRKPSTSSFSTRLAALDVQQHVVGLDQVLDRVRQLAAAPVFETVDLAVAAFDQRLVALDHGGHLLALVRMDQEHDFVMTHGGFLCGCGLSTDRAAPRRSRERDSHPVEQGNPRALCQREREIMAGIRELGTNPGPGQAAASGGWSALVVKLSPQPHSAATLGLRNTNCSFRPLLHEVDLGAVDQGQALGVDVDAHAVLLEHGVAGALRPWRGRPRSPSPNSRSASRRSAGRARRGVSAR